MEKISFHTELSESYKETDKTKKITYADGSEISGPVVTDNISTNTYEDLTAYNLEFIANTGSPDHNLYD